MSTVLYSILWSRRDITGNLILFSNDCSNTNAHTYRKQNRLFDLMTCLEPAKKQKQKQKQKRNKYFCLRSTYVSVINMLYAYVYERDYTRVDGRLFIGGTKL